MGVSTKTPQQSHHIAVHGNAGEQPPRVISLTWATPASYLLAYLEVVPSRAGRRGEAAEADHVRRKPSCAHNNGNKPQSAPYLLMVGNDLADAARKPFSDLSLDGAGW